MNQCQNCRRKAISSPYLSLLNLTDRTSLENSSSITCFFFRSSQTKTEKRKPEKLDLQVYSSRVPSLPERDSLDDKATCRLVWFEMNTVSKQPWLVKQPGLVWFEMNSAFKTASIAQHPSPQIKQLSTDGSDRHRHAAKTTSTLAADENSSHRPQVTFHSGIHTHPLLVNGDISHARPTALTAESPVISSVPTLPFVRKAVGQTIDYVIGFMLDLRGENGAINPPICAACSAGWFHSYRSVFRPVNLFFTIVSTCLFSAVSFPYKQLRPLLSKSCLILE